MVNVVGVCFRKGNGKKSGKPYEAYVVYYTEARDDGSVDGQITGDAFIDVSLLKGRIPRPGDQMVLMYNKHGFLQQVEFF